MKLNLHFNAKHHAITWGVNFSLRIERARKIIYLWSYYLKHWCGDTTFLMQKKYSSEKAECMCKIVKESRGLEFLQLLKISISFNLSKIYFTKFFKIVPVSSPMGNKKIKKIWGYWLSLMVSRLSLLLCNRTIPS